MALVNAQSDMGEGARGRAGVQQNEAGRAYLRREHEGQRFLTMPRCVRPGQASRPTRPRTARLRELPRRMPLHAVAPQVTMCLFIHLAASSTEYEIVTALHS